MNSTDCLKALDRESARSDFAAIVVGYPEQTRFVWSASADPAARLEALRRAGGKPVAVLGASIAGNALIYWLTPFQEFSENEETDRYLAAVGENVAGIVERRLQALRN
jgi:hypothetical protein